MKTKLFNLLLFVCFFAMISSCSNEEPIIDSDEKPVKLIENPERIDTRGFTGYYIVLVEVDPACKIRVIAQVSKLFNYNMMVAKGLVESAPSYLAKVETQGAAEWYVRKLVDVGAKVRLE